ncbi:SIS domain-containing protein [bacterium]|nr:SIS domain-containing protein [bacterium]
MPTHIAAARRTAALESVLGYLSDLSETIERVNVDPIVDVVRVLEEAFAEGSTVYIAGNGGSAATASHFAVDLAKTVRGYPPGPPSDGFQVWSLADNAGLITAWANDEGYDRVFSEQVLRAGKPGDVLIVISGSGNSGNVVKAVEAAQEQSMITIGFLGMGGGKLGPMVDYPVVIQSDDYGVIEDAHMVLVHLIARHFRLVDKKKLKKETRQIVRESNGVTPPLRLHGGIERKRNKHGRWIVTRTNSRNGA